MKLLVIGGGGREHAIVKKLRENPAVEVIYCLPGNGGIAADAVCVPEIGAKDIAAQAAFAKAHGIDYAVVAPDDPLALGAVDALTAAGVPCFGPDAKAAVIEASKAFSKELMHKYNIPTARYAVFSDPAAACAYLDDHQEAVHAMMEDKVFGASGNRIVIEEFLTGPEVSVLSFTDGKTVVPMVSSMDHKRAGEGDTGLNTGGMGTVAPNPFYTPEIAKVCMDTIFLPTIRAMAAEGRPFKDCLYFGLMLTVDGPKVIEYNCRFGDPETQVVLPLLKSDLLTVMQATTNGTLAQTPVELADGAACCVIAASQGYPAAYEKGFPVTMTAESAAHAYVAGARLQEGQLVTSGGRVLGVTAVADTLPEAVKEAYRLIDGVQFENRFFRRDIGAKALAALEGRS